MRLLLTIFVCVAAISITAFYPQDVLTEYMRSILRNARANPILKTLRANVTTSNRTFSAMAPSNTFVGLPVIPPEDPCLNAANPVPRAINKVFEAREQSEGAGATVRRSIGTAKLRNFTPFLM